MIHGNAFDCSFFQAAGTSISSDLSTIVIGAVHLAATFAGAMLVDRAGRRLLLLISISVMSVALLALGLFFFIRQRDLEMAENIGWLPITSLTIYTIAFALGFGPIPWLLVAELYSKDVNAIMSSVTGAMNPCLTFIVASSFSSISSVVGIGGAFWIFAAFSIVGTVFVYLKVPETKGKSLSEIQKMLAGEKKVRSEF